MEYVIMILIVLAVGLTAIALTFGTLYLDLRRRMQTTEVYIEVEGDDIGDFMQEAMLYTEYDLAARNGDGEYDLAKSNGAAKSE